MKHSVRVAARGIVTMVVAAAGLLIAPAPPAHAACGWSWGARPFVHSHATAGGVSVYGVGGMVWTPSGCGLTAVHVTATPEQGTPGTCAPFPSALFASSSCFVLDGVSGVAVVGTPTVLTYRVVGLTAEGTPFETTGSCTVAMPAVGGELHC